MYRKFILRLLFQRSSAIPCDAHFINVINVSITPRLPSATLGYMAIDFKKVFCS